jgi:mannose/fructose/N-acetylgalactosamine-specific phosphotransferase system component IIC
MKTRLAVIVGALALFLLGAFTGQVNADAMTAANLSTVVAILPDRSITTAALFGTLFLTLLGLLVQTQKAGRSP